MKNYAFFLLLLFACFSLNGQNIQKRDSLLSIVKNKPIIKVEIETYLELGNVYQYNIPDSAEWYFERAKNGAMHLNDYNALVRSLIGLGNCYAFWCNYEKALGIYIEALSYSERLKDQTKMATCYSSIGIIYADQGIYDTTIMYFQKSLEIFETLKDTAGLAKCYNNIGLVYDCQGKYNQAIQEYTKSMEIDTKQNNQSDLSIDYNNIGASYFNKGDYTKALDYYFKSLKIREQLGDKNGIAQCYNNIAIVHSNMHNNDKAVEYYDKSLSIKLELNDLRGIASCYNNIGSQFYETHNYPKALEFFVKSLEIRKSLNDLDGIGQCNDNIAVVYADMGQYNDALSYYYKNIKIHKTLGDRDGLSLNYLNIASSCRDLGNYSDAMDYANKGLIIAQKLENLNLLKASYYVLSNIYVSTADYKKALDYYILFKQANDSIYSKESSEQLNKLEIQYQTERKQIEIDKLNQQNELQKLQIRHQKDVNQEVIIFSSFIIVLILLTGFLIYISRKRKQELLFQKQMAYITQLKMLNVRNRISPHFFFNVLGSIEGLANQPDIFRKKLHNLSLLMRKTIENIDRITVTLEDELQVVTSFVDLYRDKVDGGLSFSIYVEEKIDRHQLIPAMIIQIPVENAIIHGLMPKTGGNNVLLVNIKQHDENIIIDIVDNGVGLANISKVTVGTGTGLKVITQTIQLLNASGNKEISFELFERHEHKETSETVTQIRIPINYQYSNI